MKIYLVTGVAGFIGSSIARQLLMQGHHVAGVDNLKTGKRSNIPDGVDFVEGDIRDLTSLRRAFSKTKFTAILHLAGQSSGEISHDDPEYDLTTNALGTLNVLSLATELGCRRFLHASTMGVYGQVTPDMCPVREDMNVEPLSFYGASKLAAEKYLNYFATKGIDATAFRMFNVYGPGQDLENMKQGMVSIYMAYLLKNQPIVVKGNLDRFRDFIFIDDVVSAWIGAIDCRQTYGRIYNLGTGKKSYVRELIEKLQVLFDVQDRVMGAEQTPGDQVGIYPDISALEKDLGWRAQWSLDDGLKKMKEYYSSRC